MVHGPDATNEDIIMCDLAPSLEAILNGCSNGIGLECAKALYAAGGTVVMACRSGSKSARAQEEILSLESGDRQKRLHLLDVDLGNWTSVEKCAQAFIGLNLPLDCLICNAGINGVPTWGLYTPGVETQFAVNFLGHYHLATLLDGKLRSTANSRLVIVSSETHRRVSEKGFDLERELPPREQNYKDLHAYAFSNLCRTLWARALATKVPYPVVSVHPGLSANTGMLQHMGFGAFVRQIWCVLRWEPKSFFTLQSLPQVAATQTWAAVEPVSQLAALSGAYLNGNAGKTLGVPDTPSELAQREELAEKADLMDGAEGLAAAAVWQLAQELHERQANHRTNGAVGYTYHMRLQAFQLTGDAMLDLLTDSPEAARLAEHPIGVIAEGVRTASGTSADEFMKYVEGAQRRRDPANRQQSSTFYVIEVTQADYYEGWGLHGRFILVESAVMDCLSEDKGLVAVREGYDRYRGVYHLRSLAKSWKNPPDSEVAVNGSSLTWLLREVFTGGSVEAHILFCLGQGKPAVSIALMELMEDFARVQTNPVTQDHRVAGWARAMRAERISLKQAAERGGGGGGGGGDKDTRSLILELEKRLATAERAKEEAQRVADARQERAHTFQDKYVIALENQESMNERLIQSEEEQLKAMQAKVEAQMEASEIKDECSEMQYTDNVLLMMLEQEVAELKEAASRQMGALSGKKVKHLEEAETTVEETWKCAKLQAEIQKEVERGDLENRIYELQLQLREGRLGETVQHVEEKRKIEEGMKEEDERSRARQVIDDGEYTVRRQVQKEKEQIQIELAEELLLRQIEAEKRKMEERMREEAEQMRKAMEDEQSRAKQVMDDGEVSVQRQIEDQRRQLQAEKEHFQLELAEERKQLDAAKERHQNDVNAAADAKRIQDRLLEEVQSLKHASPFSPGAANAAANADLVEQNRALQARVTFLESKSPPDKRAQAQRLAFLEKSIRNLEAERSELLVRATVAEEQLKQLQKHLKERAQKLSYERLMGNQLTCGCCAKEGGSLVEDQDSRPAFFCRKSCGLDELETDFFTCDPAGVCFEDTLGAIDERLSFSFAGSSNLAALRWGFVHGANPKVADSNGTTLLHVAARAGSFQVVKDLVLRSVDVNACDCAGWTPLHVASCMGRQDVSLYLLQMGARTSKTSRGLTPEKLCSHPHTKEVVVGFEERRPKALQARSRRLLWFIRIALHERRHSADFGWRNDLQSIEEPKPASSRLAGQCSNGSTPTMSHGSEAEGDWQLQAMRLENKEVDLRCSETEALIQAKVRQLESGRDQLMQEQKQLREMQRALKRQEGQRLHQEQRERQEPMTLSSPETLRSTAFSPGDSVPGDGGLSAQYAALQQQRMVALRAAQRAEEAQRRLEELQQSEAASLAAAAGGAHARKQLEARLQAHAVEAESLVAAAEAAGREELRKVLAEGYAGLRGAVQLGSKQSSFWKAEADFASAESKVEEQAEAAWSEAVKNQLAAKKHRQLRDELEIQERRRMERLHALEMEKRQVVLEEEAQERARKDFRKELQAELQEAESAWLQKMAPIWREESEEVKRKARSIDLEMQYQQQRMQHWYADESTSLAAREEAKAEAWLSQVWARAEAQAEREVGSVRAMQQRVVQCLDHLPPPRDDARELQLQQRVWHVEALAEEAAAREVAGHQAEVQACSTAMQALEATQQAACRQQLAEAERQHEARCHELEERGMDAARRESEEQEMKYLQKLQAAERSRDEALEAVEAMKQRSAVLHEEEIATMAKMEEHIIARRQALLGRHRTVFSARPERAGLPSFGSSSSTRTLQRPSGTVEPIEPWKLREPMVSDSFDREVLGQESSQDSAFKMQRLLESWGQDYCRSSPRRGSSNGSFNAELCNWPDVREAIDDWGKSHLPLASDEPEEAPVYRRPLPDVPPVYQAAVAAIEQYGWQAIHGDAQEWTALHWSAVEGNLEVCHRLLIALANPLQVDQAGKSSLDYALEAGNADVFELLSTAALGYLCAAHQIQNLLVRAPLNLAQDYTLNRSSYLASRYCTSHGIGSCLSPCKLAASQAKLRNLIGHQQILKLFTSWLWTKTPLKTMLAGLKFGKKEVEEKEEKTLSKKEKKKEKRKEQKKRKKGKKDKKGDKEPSEASSAQESDGEEKVKNVKETDEKAMVKEPTGEEEEVAKAEVDFFGSMGKEREKDAKLKEDPDKVKVSEKEYNPFLRGEESNLPVPKSATASSIPEHLRVGPAWGVSNDWRKRLHRRRQDATNSQKADGNNDEGGKSREDAPPRRTEPEERPKKPPGRGPTAGGWRAAKKAAPRRSPSRKRSRSRSRSRSRRRGRSRSRSRKRQRARSSSSHSSADARAERRKEQVATAVLNRVKSSEAAGEVEDDADEIIRQLKSKYDKSNGVAESSNPAEDVEEDIDPNKLGALAMEAML
eukprot:symbB.v1.2.034296.t1/scaffold4400.1/size40136/1